ncbi:unnamed protein product [Notodromas monacha]|uniref:Winged helix Storkhead-box1 domain-containing protein n=1 Tax=Notodromas monacha TaxID=399045 RepID=A0A7R9BGI2_9CRUS|nr:unnamed protein product [Notodromas monacha]CAG0913448.1 unnamed protein product [Notodromas monacha]
MLTGRRISYLPAVFRPESGSSLNPVIAAESGWIKRCPVLLVAKLAAWSAYWRKLLRNLTSSVFPWGNFVGANSGCWWNRGLQVALHGATFAGWASPGILLLSGSPRLLEPFRTAWTRRVLRPPPGYIILAMGDVEECCIRGVPQGQFTPLPDALCWVIHDLLHSESGTATLDRILASLGDYFPETVRPSKDLIYVTLGKLIRERKVSHHELVETRKESACPGRDPLNSRLGNLCEVTVGCYFRADRGVVHEQLGCSNLCMRSTWVGKNSGSVRQLFPYFPTKKRINYTVMSGFGLQVYQVRGGGYEIVNPGNSQEMIPRMLHRQRPLLFSSEEALDLIHTKGFTYSSPSPANRFQDFICQVSLADIMKGELEGDIICRTRSGKNSSVDGLNTLMQNSSISRLQRHFSLRLHAAAASTLRRARRGGSLRSSSAKRPEVKDACVYQNHNLDLSYLKMDITIEPSKKPSLLERIFHPQLRPPLVEFSAQFPPPEWDDPRLRILHSVGTQTAHTHSARESPESALRGRRPTVRTRRDEPGSFARSRSLPSRIPPSVAAVMASNQIQSRGGFGGPCPRRQMPLDRTVSDSRSPSITSHPYAQPKRTGPPVGFQRQPKAASFSRPNPNKVSPVPETQPFSASQTKNLKCPSLLRTIQSPTVGSSSSCSSSSQATSLLGSKYNPIIRVVKIERTEETTNTTPGTGNQPTTTTKSFRKTSFPTQTTIQENIPLDANPNCRYKKVTIEKFEETTITEESVLPPPAVRGSPLATITDPEVAVKVLTRRESCPAGGSQRRYHSPYSYHRQSSFADGLKATPKGPCFDRIPSSLRQTSTPRLQADATVVNEPTEPVPSEKSAITPGVSNSIPSGMLRTSFIPVRQQLTPSPAQSTAKEDVHSTLQSPVAASENNVDRVRSDEDHTEVPHATAARTSSAPLGICLSSKQTSYPGSRKGHGAIYANPLADVAMLQEENWGQFSSIVSVEPASGSEGYGSRSSTPSNVKIAANPVKQPKKEPPLETGRPSPSVGPDSFIMSPSPTGQTDDSKLWKLFVHPTNKPGCSSATSNDASEQAAPKSPLQATSAETSRCQQSEPAVSDGGSTEAQQQFEFNIKISGYSQLDALNSHQVCNTDVMQKLESIHNDLKRSQNGPSASTSVATNDAAVLPPEPIPESRPLAINRPKLAEELKLVHRQVYFSDGHLFFPSERRESQTTLVTLHEVMCYAKSLGEELSGSILSVNIPKPGISDALPPELPEHHYLSLSDLTVTFKSVVGQKLLQGCSANSIDTLMELDLAARNNCLPKMRNSLVQTDLGLI